MNEFKVHELWPIPVYENHIDVKFEWLDKCKNSNYQRMHTKNGFISEDRYILNELPELKKEIENHCKLFTEKYMGTTNKVEFYLQNSWFLKHVKNDWGQIHYHSNSLLSGVYYLKTPPNSGNINFHKNCLHMNMFPPSIRMENDIRNHFTAEQYSLTPEEGLIIIFPAQLEHSIGTNKSEGDRYSVAFNFYLRGTLGKEEYILEIK
jgi:uncharacterized protein (TIGR02466 family)